MDRKTPGKLACPAPDTRRDKRRRAMLDAASSLFFEKGYEATTLGEIVARSGGSLTTLYELFGNKPGLLTALVTERCEGIAGLIECVAIAGLQPREALGAIARHLFSRLTDASGIALFRIVISESTRQPELGQRFYEAGPATGRRIMGRFLAQQAADGLLDVDDADEAARYFFDMLLGDHQMRLLCGLAVAADSEEVARHVDRTVDAFVRLYARR